MTDTAKQKLRAILKTRRRAVLEDGATGKPITDLQPALFAISVYSEIAKMSESVWSSDSVLASIVALIVLIVVGLLWSLKVQKSDISLVAETDNVHITLMNAWDVEDIVSGKDIHLDQLTSVSDPNLGLALDKSEGNVWMRVQGDSVTVESLKLDQGGNLTLAADTNLLELLMSGKPIKGTVQIVGKGILTAGISDTEMVNKPFNLLVPETIEFSNDSTNRAIAQVIVHSPSAWVFGPLACADVGFSYELRSLAERQVLSGISSGILQFTDVSWPAIPLAENEELYIGGSGRAHTRLTSKNGAIQVVLNGSVKDVIVGEADHQRRVAPSYLEYLYNNKSLLLFWIAVTAGWGLLWGVRKTLLR